MSRMEKEFIDLFALQSALKQGVESLFPKRVWIKAEVSAIKARSGGHNLGLKVPSMALYSPYRRSQADYPPQSWRNMCRAEIAEKSENFL